MSGGSRNARIGALCAGLVLAMVGMAYAAVPLYDMFCRVTGFAGTTNVADAATGTILDRDMTIEFDASLAQGMPWTFTPLQRSIRIKVGEVALAKYRVHNPTSRIIVGSATYNVTPQKAGFYFDKIECFCFTEQKLGPGETADLPVTFFVDPAIADDSNLDDVETVTLSYTFFEARAEEPGQVSLEGGD